MGFGLDGLGDGQHLEAVLLGGLGAGAGLLVQTDDDVDAAVAQVLRVGVALAAVTDDGNGLALDRGDFGGLGVVDGDGHRCAS